MKTIGSEDIIAGDAAFTPRRGRPTATQALAIDRAINGAAMRAFLCDGYEGTAMEAVALAAGVPKSTLYKRYPDKRALLRAVLSERVSAWCLAEQAHDPGNDLETRLKRISADILHRAIMPEVQAFWRLASTAWSDPDEAAQRQDAIGYTKMVNALEQEIREFGPSSGIAARDPHQVAVALMAMLGGWIEYVGPTGSRTGEEAERFAHAAVAMLMGGTLAW